MNSFSDSPTALFINFPAVADLHHQHQQNFVVNLVENAVIPGSQAVKLGEALELFYAGWPGIAGEAFDFAG